MSEKIRNIIFDVGNVLIDFCWQAVCEQLGYSREIIETFDKYMITSGYWDQLDEGTIQQEDAIEEFVKAMPQYESEVREFWNHAEDFVKEYDYAFSMIEGLKKKGYGVYLLSNYPLEMYKLHWPSFSFYSIVDGYVVSAVEKLRKPDKAIYKLLCDRYQLEEASCLFFDDRAVNVEAAISCGMKAKLFTGIETVEKTIC